MTEPPEPAGTFRKRCCRYSEAGHAHFLTFSCFRRQPFLVRDRCRQWLADAIRLAQQKHALHLWAYVFMPEHAHLLIWPTLEAYDLSAILTTLKQSVSKRAVRWVEGNARWFIPHMLDVQPNGKQTVRFWQRGGGYDRNLWEPQEVWEKIDYIHNNPVKRGLCGRVEDWVWSSAADYLGVRKGPLDVERSSIPADPR